MASRAAKRGSPRSPKKRPRPGGFTLIELMVATFLATISAVYIFSSYVDVARGFRIQAKRADRVREMVSAKTIIVKAMANVESLILVAPDKCMFGQKGDSLTHTVEYRGGELLRDGKTVQKNVKSFAFKQSEKATPDGRRAVRWEGILSRGGWVGGVIVAPEAELGPGRE